MNISGAGDRRTLGVLKRRNMIDSILHVARIIFISWLFMGSPAWATDSPTIAWGQEFDGLSFGISLKDDEHKPLSVVHIFLWAETNDGREPPMINPFSIKLMNYTPQGKSIQRASTSTDTWEKFRWKQMSDTTYKSKLLKVSSKPSGEWGIEVTIPIVWKGKSTEIKTGILNYKMR